MAGKLRDQICIEVISNQKSFECSILKPLVDLAEEEKKLEEEVQQAIQQRPAAGSELKLMKLLQSNGFGQEVAHHSRNREKEKRIILGENGEMNTIMAHFAWFYSHLRNFYIV